MDVSLRKTSSQFPTLLSTSKFKSSGRMRLELNLSSKSISNPKPETSLVSSATPKSVILSKEALHSPTKLSPSKLPVKHFTIKPVSFSEILKYPASPSEVIQSFPNLPDWVILELKSVNQIYYFCSSTKTPNFTYECENGEYNFVEGDDINYRYEILEILGKGTFGQVVKVFDHLEKKTLALKIIKNKQRYTEQAMIEIEILNYLKKSDANTKNFVIQIEASFEFRNHIVRSMQMIAFEMLGLNLYELLKRNSFRGLSVSLIKRFSIQILRALLVLSENYIIHCDLKPENLLLSDSNLESVKLIDFGSSCYSNQRVYSYIQSRFYRAPEVILGIPYTNAIDMWSLGCILVELYTGIPIFASDCEKDLISKIAEVIGSPSLNVLQAGSRSHIFFQGSDLKNDPTIRKRAPGGRNLRRILKGADEDFLQIIEGCLSWDPSERITPENALKSPWFCDINNRNHSSATRKYKISIEDITKKTPQLQKFIAHRANTMK